MSFLSSRVGVISIVLLQNLNFSLKTVGILKIFIEVQESQFNIYVMLEIINKTIDLFDLTHLTMSQPNKKL